jgi:hypothetical protein
MPDVAFSKDSSHTQSPQGPPPREDISEQELNPTCGSQLRMQLQRVSLALTLSSVGALTPTMVCLDGVHNFRPVSPLLPGLYRSAALEQATASDAAIILDSARIRTIVDLRNQDEIDRARAQSTEMGRKLLAAFDGQAAVGPSQVASEGAGVLTRHHVPLLGDVDGFLDEVATRLSPAKKAQAAMYRAVDMRRHDQLLYDELARGQQHWPPLYYYAATTVLPLLYCHC